MPVSAWALREEPLLVHRKHDHSSGVSNHLLSQRCGTGAFACITFAQHAERPLVGIMLIDAGCQPVDPVGNHIYHERLLPAHFARLRLGLRCVLKTKRLFRALLG
ncbi:MAG: hypothetical protein MUF54_21210, partial [Polyangiaceae bacterium]|nr:hypothetical protein [Polyangiaceae bacterium]